MPQFEIYWKKLDPNDTGKVAPMEAATFLKNSGLSDQTLGKVIDIFFSDLVTTLRRFHLIVSIILMQ